MTHRTSTRTRTRTNIPSMNRIVVNAVDAYWNRIMANFNQCRAHIKQ